MFEPVPSDVSFPDEENQLLEFWRREDVFQRSVEQCRDRPRYVFYEGPPTANGLPHWGSVLTRVGKDVFLRYKTMTGYYVPRRSGWDTHGLPVEVEVEKALGLKGKVDIEKMGIAAFTRACIDSVFRYIGEWQRMSERIAFWLDFDEGYATYHRSYVESVWWALKTLYERGLLYQGHKSVWWWPQGGTALSASEVGEGYRAVDDPSVVVCFPVAGRKDTHLLAWTTTPWTLPSNVALAVAADETYVEAEYEGRTLILAEALAAAVLEEDEPAIRRRFPGSELQGLRYEPLFTIRAPSEGKAHEVTTADFVTLDSGTGIVHMAPGFGEDDFRVSSEQGFGFLQILDPDGRFPDDAGPLAGLYFKDADKVVMADLKERGLLLRRKTYRHDYPFCPRAENDPLIQYARESWFIRTSTEKDRVVANNAKVRWQPEHIRDGRMGDFLRNNVDWAISRERWWGTPLPIWVNDETGAMEAVGSVAEILERNPRAFDAFRKAQEEDPDLPDDLMVHRPWIDGAVWTKDGEPGTYRRVPEVIDCWFDAGSMPFAQWGYPHENEDAFRTNFPADFITEAIDQTRGWWNALLQVSTLLFPDAEAPHPFRSCVVLGHIVDEEGKKLSKRHKNYEPPVDAIDRYSADAVRWALLQHGTPALSNRFHGGVAKDATRDVLLKVWNVYSFLATYARIDKWSPKEARPAPKDRPEADRWILAELDRTVRDVREAFENLESHTAARRLLAFVDALSNWYVRLNRDRFWGDDAADKRSAYATLYETLTDLARLLAPITPFLAETLHQKLVRPFADDAPVSIHLADYPEPDDARRDDALRADTDLVRHLVALGLRVRNTEKIKVRQPLREAVLVLAGGETVRSTEAIRDELHVLDVTVSDEPARYVTHEIVPNFRALGPKLGKDMPLCKKALAAADGSALQAQLEAGGAISLELGDGETVELGPDDVAVRLHAKEGYAAAAEGGRVVILKTEIDEELKLRGLAREFISRVQGLRKDRKLPYEARITITHDAEGLVKEAVRVHEEWIKGETLALDIRVAGDGAAVAIEDEEFSLGIEVCDGP